MASVIEGDDFGPKKHKKHRREKSEDKPGLRLILKVGSSSTPEHSNDSHGPGVGGDEESMQSLGADLTMQLGRPDDRQHKKAKKKKKKKEKDKDRDKHDKKKKHHHKEKRKRPRDESSQDDVSVGEESLQEPPPTKRPAVDKTPDVGGDSPIGSPSSSREPRLCVQLLRQRQELLSAKSPLQKLLDNLQQSLEKKDPQQFFAWPVTDQIAPGYSQIIHQPMDFSTMHQKIEDNNYSNLKDYIDDFKQMCGNAMIYNHPETIYYKAAKRLLHAGLKLVCEEKLRSLAVTMPLILQIPREQLGFDLGTPGRESEREDEEENVPPPSHPQRRGPNFLPENKFEAIPDDLTPDEILEQARKAAQKVRQRLDLKKVNTKMGFLRTQKDGTTSLAILVPGEGLDPESNERPVCLGQLIGKIPHGSGVLQGFREDRRNITKTVKPLYYGAFGSYAPSYDSTFANLSKEESDLVFQTYGDESAVQYAESILNFAKDCDYTLTMVDNLLDLLTGGDHRKTKKVLEERRRFREEEERVRQLMTPAAQPTLTDVKVDVTQLKTLADLGIETTFLDYFDKGSKEENAMQERLDQTTALLEKLQQVQSDRLSAPPPQHLANIMQPSDTELNLAEKITESLTQLAKQVPPSAVVSIPAIRKAMGISPDTATVGTATDPPPAPPRSQSPSPPPPSLPATVDKSTSEDSSGGEEEGVGVDLESELREFLESDTALTNFPLHDDKTIEEMLSES